MAVSASGASAEIVAAAKAACAHEFIMGFPLGYNTPVHNPPSPEHDNLANFHNHLVMQSGAY